MYALTSTARRTLAVMAMAALGCGAPADQDIGNYVQDPNQRIATDSDKAKSSELSSTTQAASFSLPVDYTTSGQVYAGQANWYQSSYLAPGTYTVTLSTDPYLYGGDADMYVRVNGWPTASLFDCRPYRNDSNETCQVQLYQGGQIHIAVVGSAQTASSYQLRIGGSTNGGSLPIQGMTTLVANQEVRYTTQQLPPGYYSVDIQGSGDADLYVRVNGAPSLSTYDCRPYLNNSYESCIISMPAGGSIFVLLRGGYAYSSSVTLRIAQYGYGGGYPNPYPQPSPYPQPNPNPNPYPYPYPQPTWPGAHMDGVVVANQEIYVNSGFHGAGRYVVTMTGTGDADLYVARVNNLQTFAAQPTTWICRPYLNNSYEQCVVDVNQSEGVLVLVKGYAQYSQFALDVRLQ